MYVSINKEKMHFMHKHQSHQVVRDLVWIECSVVTTLITPIYAYFLSGFTDTELQLLYRNTASGEWAKWQGDKLRAVLHEMAERLEPTDVDVNEVALQASAVQEGDVACYRYVKGARMPAKIADLWEPDIKKVPALELPLESKVAADFRTRITDPATEPRVEIGSNFAPTSKSENTAAPRVLTEPVGGVRGQIWEVADRMWAEAGKPTHVGTVLALRKKMMEVLETQGVKRNSASSELGAWQKMRLA